MQLQVSCITLFLICQFSLVFPIPPRHFVYRPPPLPPPLPGAPPPYYPILPPNHPRPENDAPQSDSDEKWRIPVERRGGPGFRRSRDFPVENLSTSVESEESSIESKEPTSRKRSSTARIPKYKVDRTKQFRKFLHRQQEMKKAENIGTKETLPECPPEPKKRKLKQRNGARIPKYRVNRSRKFKNCRPRPKEEVDDDEESEEFEESSAESVEEISRTSNNPTVRTRHPKRYNCFFPPPPVRVSQYKVNRKTKNILMSVSSDEVKKDVDEESVENINREAKFGLGSLELTITKPKKEKLYPLPPPKHKQAEPVPIHAFDPDLDPEIQKLRIELYKGFRRWKKWKKINMHEYSQLMGLGLVNAIQFMTFI